MTGSDKQHWEEVYATKPADTVSWFQPSAVTSLAALDRLGAMPGQSLIDIGGGASTLVDTLLDRGWSDLSVLDISEAALAVAKGRLGPDAESVDWIAADITRWSAKRTFEIWHDRAVFHFLTDPADRDADKERMIGALEPGGAVVMATFSMVGPERCSGLTVQRYDRETLATELGSAFKRIGDWTEEHVTPMGYRQSFTWCLFRRDSGR
jgi:2-polyprenyl-3-methyl-5-hydroxy-6-metoxy-1,4-benzoquinol methylase